MSAQAIINLLLPKHHGLLEEYLARQACTVYTLHQPASEALQQMASRGKARIIDLNTLVTPNADAAVKLEVERRFSVLAKQPESQEFSLLEQSLAKQILAEEMQLIDRLDAALSRGPVAALLVSEEYTHIGRTALQWARQRRVPSVHICHAASINRIYTVHRPAVADYYGLVGTRAGDTLIDAGVPAERLVPIGNSDWEYYLNAKQLRPRVRAELFHNHRLDTAKPTILFATTWSAELSALNADRAIYLETLQAFFSACAALLAAGYQFNCVIKDRLGSFDSPSERVRELAQQAGIPETGLVHVFDDPRPWVLSADIVVGMESNMLVEALLAGTIPVNLWHDDSHVLGPGFAAHEGVVHVTAETLGSTLQRLLEDSRWREHLRQEARAILPTLLASQRPGQSSANLADLLTHMEATAILAPAAVLAQPSISPAAHAAEIRLPATQERRFVWQRSLAVADNEASGYHDNARRDLIDALEFSPRRALDIGCGTGATFAYLKTRHPQCETWGIEVNRAAANIAKERLDHVAVGKFEEIDLAAFGLLPGSLDLILCADVLEHMYDPWSVVVALKDYLAEEGRLVISIPNLRYLPLLDDLAHGYFRYADWGVLDITHLRFFTRKELERFLFETGYEVVRWTHGIDPTLRTQFEQASRKLPATLDTGKLVLRDLSAEDLQELYSGQFFVTVKKGQPQLVGYQPPRMGCYFWRGHQTDYLNFLATHQLLEHEAQAFDRWLATRAAPRFEILVVHGGDQALLTRTIGSAARWLYDHFRLTVLADGDAPPALAGHERIGWLKVGAGGTASCWPDLAARLAASEADWCLILEAGDELVPHALLYLAEHALRHPQAALIYSDEDSLDAAGRPEAPYLKPDFSPDYFLAFDYLGDAVAFRRSTLLELGGLHPADDNPLRGFALRLYARHGHTAFAHLPDVLYHREPRRSLRRQQLGLPIEPVLREILPEAEISTGWLPSAARIEPRLPTQPKILLIAEASADLATMQCLVQETWGRRSYAAAELVIFVGDDLPPTTRAWLEQLDAEAPVGLSIFAHPPGLTSAARVNAAIAQSDAGLVLLLRPDATPSDSLWLERLAALALQEGIGLVAPRLVDREGKLIGNALLLGMEGFAIGLGHGESYTASGHFGRLLLPQNPSALSADIVMFARRHWEAAGGLAAEHDLPGAVIDLALRLRTSDCRALWWPYLTLVCPEGGFAGIAPADQEKLMQRWLPQLARDPAYNPNASRITPFALREHPQISRLGLPWKPLPKLMAFPADLMGCGHYRVIEPFHAVRKAGLIDGYLGTDHYDPLDMAIFEADTLLLQRQVSDAQLAFLRNYRRFFQLKLIYELDDLITNLPVESAHKGNIPKDIAKRLRQGLELCDRFIVSTEPLKEAYRDLIDDIRVVPNRIDEEKWGALAPQRRVGKKPRVGWAGGISHGGDLALIIDLIKETANEVEWVFLGMCREEFRPYLAELHPGVDTPLYPAKLAALNLDLAIAPIAENQFNDCKSNLKLLEYGILGYPVIASDFGPYRRSKDFPGVTLVKNRHKDWLAALRAHIHDLDECGRRGDALRAYIRRHWLLQDHLEEWRSAWFDF